MIIAPRAKNHKVLATDFYLHKKAISEYLGLTLFGTMQYNVFCFEENTRIQLLADSHMNIHYSGRIFYDDPFNENQASFY